MSSRPLRVRSTRQRAATVAVLAAGALALAACGGGGFEEEQEPGAQQSTGPVSLQVLIGSSGDAETQAVEAATQAWADETGNTVEVIAAADLGQQLGQGFAGGTPPDLFYTEAARLGDFAKAGNLHAYGDEIDADAFLPALVDAFTYEDELYCAPKDYSTLALIINEDLWAKAGLTDADVPKDWAELEAVAAKLTSGSTTGLVIGNDINRSGAFVKQAGGWFVNEDGTQMTADSEQVKAGLAQVKKMTEAGVLKFNTDTDPAAGWGGEAFGKGIAAMTIEGNWMRGALKNDFPTVKAMVAELPEGPGGKGTLVFTNCWGIAAKSPSKAQAVDLVEHLTSVDQQLAFAEAYGVMPSTKEGAERFAETYPQDAPFAAGAEYGQGPINLPGFEPVIADFNSDLATLSKTGDVESIVETFQENGSAALGG